MLISEAIRALQEQLDIWGDDYLYRNGDSIGIKRGCGCCVDAILHLSDIEDSIP